MPPVLAFLLSLSTAALAQTDLSVAVRSAPPVIALGDFLTLDVTVENHGPELAREVRATILLPQLLEPTYDSRCSLDGSRTLRCGVDFLAAGASTTFAVTGRLAFPHGQRSVVAAATVTAANAASRTVSHVINVLDTRLVTTVIIEPDARGADGTAIWNVAVHNGAAYTATGRKLRVTFSATEEVVRTPEGCAVVNSIVTCDLAPLEPGKSRELPFTLRHPYPASHSYTVAEVLPFGGTSTAEAVFGRRYVVTSPADSAPGSLRETIGTVNAECTNFDPCIIDFDLDAAIRPLTPLPAITARDISFVRGIQLDGSALASGHGLAFVNAGYVRVKGMHIHNFPWNGIDVRSAQGTRVRIAGNRIEANGGRGIETDRASGNVESNQLLHNGRSGAFFGVSGAVGFHFNVADANGASGVYFGPGIDQSAAEGNTITNNVHFGIALAPLARVAVRRNSIHGNNNGGIDIGLDGPTLLGTPVITSARYENGVTLIEGEAPIGAQVHLFANRSLEFGDLAEGETFLGTTSTGRFTFRYDGDLRGQYINGVTTLHSTRHIDDLVRTTSEFGRATAVE